MKKYLIKFATFIWHFPILFGRPVEEVCNIYLTFVHSVLVGGRRVLGRGISRGMFGRNAGRRGIPVALLSINKCQDIWSQGQWPNDIMINFKIGLSVTRSEKIKGQWHSRSVAYSLYVSLLIWPTSEAMIDDFISVIHWPILNISEIKEQQ